MQQTLRSATKEGAVADSYYHPEGWLHIKATKEESEEGKEEEEDNFCPGQAASLFSQLCTCVTLNSFPCTALLAQVVVIRYDLKYLLDYQKILLKTSTLSSFSHCLF